MRELGPAYKVAACYRDPVSRRVIDRMVTQLQRAGARGIHVYRDSGGCWVLACRRKDFQHVEKVAARTP
jgi:hypothetical protein